jgi:tetratricopeptide (TPR) repeat protein
MQMNAGVRAALIGVLAVAGAHVVVPFARAQEGNPDGLTVAQRFDLLGGEYMEEKAYPEAVAAYQQAVEADSTMALAWKHLALAYTELGREDPQYFQEADAIYQRLSKMLPPDDVEMLRGRAYLMALAGNYDGAVADYRVILEQLPEDCDAWAKLSQVRSVQSEVVIETVGLSTPELVTYADEMIDAQLQLLRLCPEKVSDYQSLFDMFTRSRRYEEGAETFQGLLDLHPGDVELIRPTGDLYFMSRNWAEATRLFGELLDLQAENQEYRLKYISSLRKLERFEEADEELQKYIEIRDAQEQKSDGEDGNR